MTPMARVEDAAAYITTRLGGCSAAKLHKLLYHCQGWHLAWEGVTLYQADIVAAPTGPVIADLYQLHTGAHTLPTSWPTTGDPTRLTRAEAETIDAVCDTYANWTSEQLSAHTRRETPWVTARARRSSTDPHPRINVEELRRHYHQLNAS